MLTNDDVKKLLSVFATKRDLEDQEERIDLKFSKVLTGLDKVYGEVKAMRDEQSAHSQQHEDTDNILKIHDKKIQKLEKAITTV